MSWLDFLEILKTIGGAAGAIITLAALWGMIFKKPRDWIKKIAKEAAAEAYEERGIKEGENTNQINKDMSDIKAVLDDIKGQLNAQNQNDLVMLRHEITTLYVAYKDEKRIPTRAKQDWLSLYERYTRLNGNSYVKTITQNMEEWEEF